MDPYLTHPRPGVSADAIGNPDVDTVVRFDDNGQPYLTTEPAPTRAPVVVPHRPPSEPAGPAPMVVYTHGQPDYGPLAGPPAYNPLRDPIVMRLLAGAIAVGIGAIALSFALAGGGRPPQGPGGGGPGVQGVWAAAEMALGLLLAVLLLIWLMTSGRGSGGKSVNNITIHNTNKSRRWR